LGLGDGDQLNTESEWSDGVKANLGYDYRLLMVEALIGTNLLGSTQ